MTRVLRSDAQRRLDTPGGNTTTTLAAPSTGAAQLLVILQEQAPGGSNPLHRKSTEALVVLLSGEVSVGGPTASVTLGAGDVVLVAPDEEHQIRNVGATSASWLVVTPAGVTFRGADGAPVVPVWAA